LKGVHRANQKRGFAANVPLRCYPAANMNLAVFLKLVFEIA
jgi:hypothetical protein